MGGGFLAVASTWDYRKGLNDYLTLSRMIPMDSTIVLLGLSEEQIESTNVYPNIIGLPRTNNVQELIFYYSVCNAVLNLSREETFGLTTVEGMACGTPSIVFNCTASPELVDEHTGMVVEPGNLDGVKDAICKIKANGKAYYSNHCIERANRLFAAQDRYRDYINIYSKMVFK